MQFHSLPLKINQFVLPCLGGLIGCMCVCFCAEAPTAEAPAFVAAAISEATTPVAEVESKAVVPGMESQSPFESYIEGLLNA
jgi:hypothetical protein